MLYNRNFFWTRIPCKRQIWVLPDTTVRCSPFNPFNLSQALTFRWPVPWTFFAFFSCIKLHFEFLWICRLRWSNKSCSVPLRLPSNDLNDLLNKLRHSSHLSVTLSRPFWIFSFKNTTELRLERKKEWKEERKKERETEREKERKKERNKEGSNFLKNYYWTEETTSGDTLCVY